MKQEKKGIALLLVVLLLLSMLPLSVYAEGDILELDSPQAFLTFSQMCRYDAYSEGLTVRLTADLDMTGLGFEDIPIFLGYFDGGGHTITGIESPLEQDGQGLFRHIAQGATVSDLTVLAMVKTEQSVVGGIAALNYGTIQNCTYSGLVSGVDTIGGIVGENHGTILSCTVSGGVFGETQVGGVAGVNQGTILRCENLSNVNTDLSDFSFSLEDRLVANINLNSDTLNIADIGGIAGSSEGIIQSCTNGGTVGYPHVGYNIGGIVGRQSGYVSNCTNTGFVQGRKEVGGIVGQFEPYVDTLYSISKLQLLRDEIDVLSQLTSQFTSDAKDSNSLVSGTVSQLELSVDESRSQLDQLLTQTEDMVNANIDTANQISVTVADTIDALVVITESVDPITENLSQAMEHMEAMASDFAQVSEALEGVGDIVDLATQQTTQAGDSLELAVTHIQNALTIAEEMDTAPLLEDVDLALSYLGEAAEELSDVNDYVNQAITLTSDFLQNIDQDFDDVTDALSEMQKSLDDLSDGVSDLADALDQVVTALPDMVVVDTTQVDLALNEAAEALEAITNRFSGTTDQETDPELEEESQEVSNNLDTATSQLQQALAGLSAGEDVSGTLSDVIASLTQANGGIENMELVVTENQGTTDADQTGLLDGLDGLSQDISTLIGALGAVLTSLPTMVTVDTAEVYNGLKNSVDSFQDIADGFADTVTSLGDLVEALEALESVGTWAEKTSTQLDSASFSLDGALGSLKEALSQGREGLDEVEVLSQSLDDALSQLNLAGDDFIAARTALNQGIEHLHSLETVLSPANESLQSGFLHMKDGFSALGAGIDSLEVTTTLISNLMEELSQGEEVVFTKFDADYDTTRENLSQALGQVSEDIEQINQSIRLSGDLLLDDVEAINRQFTKVLDLMLEMMQDISSFVEEETYKIEDISTMDTSELYAGKVTGCENTGAVQGDINVGGIGGAMSFELSFDMEDDWKLTGDRTQTISRQGLAVIEDSVNTGEVLAKKDSAGGILGYQDFGLVQSCTTASSVASEEGRYVGGVVGQSTGYIRNCFAKSTLSGTQFVGGIVGSGYDIQNCYALTTASASKGGLGGIVGELDTKGKLKDNFFVSDTLGGIDGISFAGQAQAISYEELLQVEGVPSLFGSMTLNFYVEDQWIDSRTVDFGSELAPDTFPELPHKTGYYSHWEEPFESIVTSDLKIQGTYYPLLTTLAGTIQKDGLAVILADGQFTDQEQLRVTALPTDDQEGVVADYQVWVEGTEQNMALIRYLAPATSVAIQLNLDGQWVEVETEVDGRYILIPVETDGILSFRAVEQADQTWKLVGLGVGVLLLLGRWVIKRKKPKGKAGKPETTVVSQT